METRPLTYVSQKDIFQFLSLETRRKIASKCPQSRRYHRKLPISLKTVCFEYLDDRDGWWKYHKITLDGVTWEMRRSEDSEDLKMLTLPSGRKVDVKSDKKISEELVPRFMKHYLGRKGTQIQKLYVKDSQFPTFKIPRIKIKELHFERVSNDLDENLLSYLANSNFQKVTVIGDYHEYEDLWEKFRNLKITTDFLVIKQTNLYETAMDVQGITKRAHFLSTYASFEDFQSALDRILMDLEEHSVGTVYRANCRGMSPNINSWLEYIRNYTKSEYKYLGSRSGICLRMIGDRELFVTAKNDLLNEFSEKEHVLHPITFQAEVLKKGSTLFYDDLPAALQEKYQALVAEQTRLMRHSDHERLRRERGELRNSTLFKVRRLVRSDVMKYVFYVLLFGIAPVSMIPNFALGLCVYCAVVFLYFLLHVLLHLHFSQNSEDEDVDEADEEEEDSENEDEEEDDD